jgi:hypothetical protein
VRLPAPSSGLVRCYVKRVKNFFGTHCSFQMHLDNGDVFLLAARRRKKSKVSRWVGRGVGAEWVGGQQGVWWGVHGQQRQLAHAATAVAGDSSCESQPFMVTPGQQHTLAHACTDS